MKNRRGLWVAGLSVFVALVLLAVSYLAVSAVSSEGIPWPWGHPKHSEVLVGNWEGTYRGGTERFVLKEDHTFVQYMWDFPGLVAKENTGIWEYSAGRLRLSPGLWVTSGMTQPVGVNEYVLSPTIELEAGNTIFFWKFRLWDENTLLLKQH
jgi:hypothetical protein